MHRAAQAKTRPEGNIEQWVVIRALQAGIRVTTIERSSVYGQRIFVSGRL